MSESVKPIGTPTPNAATPWWAWLGRAVLLSYGGLLMWVNRLPPSDSTIQAASEIPHGDKLGHLVGYGGLALLAFGPAKLGRSGTAAAAAVVALVLLGVADELTQPYWDRTADPWDGVADAVAVLLGWLMVRWWVGSPEPKPN